ncbi:unnamed protein product [Pleuronectes platessa]|uniref:Uncharacterized protein n=1 Tax=Pleuronectes platessa TaxID=8262 RepID=A0A9N7VJZ0_PLEPL|nr:unnamed protein product [Pleuronectes platessa]
MQHVLFVLRKSRNSFSQGATGSFFFRNFTHRCEKSQKSTPIGHSGHMTCGSPGQYKERSPPNWLSFHKLSSREAASLSSCIGERRNLISPAQPFSSHPKRGTQGSSFRLDFSRKPSRPSSSTNS